MEKLERRHLSKEEFGRRLFNLMVKKGWRQADLHRASGLTKDSISTYIRGLTYPTPTSVVRLAQALNVKPEDLFPNHTESAIMEDHPRFEMKVSVADPTMAWLRIDMHIPIDKATRITSILHEKDPDRS